MPFVSLSTRLHSRFFTGSTIIMSTSLRHRCRLRPLWGTVPPTSRLDFYQIAHSSNYTSRINEEDDTIDWDHQFDKLRQHIQSIESAGTRRNAYIPYPQNDPTLAKWMRAQRDSYYSKIRGKSSSLSDEQKEQLEAIGYPNPTHSRFWQERYEQLEEYIRMHDCFPYDKDLQHLTDKDRKLYWWCESQKKAYKLHKTGQPSSMTAEREQKLTQLGFCWNADEESWHNRYQELQEYRAEHGDCLVSANYSNAPLAKWVGQQRFQYKLFTEGKPGGIAKERIDLLNELDFVWNTFDAIWSTRYEELRQYHARHGNCRVPFEYPENPALAYWVIEQRRTYKQTIRDGNSQGMPEERIKQLEELGFEWNVQDAKWWDQFNELRKYYQQHGDCLVPTKYPANQHLSNWVQRQRKQGKNESWDAERISALESLDFCWDARDAIWMEKYKELEEYVKMNGYGNAPSAKHLPSLRRWFNNQVKQQKLFLEGQKSSMTESRLERLKKLGFIL